MSGHPLAGGQSVAAAFLVRCPPLIQSVVSRVSESLGMYQGNLLWKIHLKGAPDRTGSDVQGLMRMQSSVLCGAVLFHLPFGEQQILETPRGLFF